MPGDFDQYHQLATATSLPLTVGEHMAGKMQFERCSSRGRQNM